MQEADTPVEVNPAEQEVDKTRALELGLKRLQDVMSYQSGIIATEGLNRNLVDAARINLELATHEHERKSKLTPDEHWTELNNEYRLRLQILAGQADKSTNPEVKKRFQEEHDKLQKAGPLGVLGIFPPSAIEVEELAEPQTTQEPATPPKEPAAATTVEQVVETPKEKETSTLLARINQLAKARSNIEDALSELERAEKAALGEERTAGTVKSEQAKLKDYQRLYQVALDDYERTLGGLPENIRTSLTGKVDSYQESLSGLNGFVDEEVEKLSQK